MAAGKGPAGWSLKNTRKSHIPENDLKVKIRLKTNGLQESGAVLEIRQSCNPHIIIIGNPPVLLERHPSLTVPGFAELLR
jgi:hypothetical protein